MANYVKFSKGSFDAYNKIIEPDKDTLYFVYSEDETECQLYLGEKLIAGGKDLKVEFADLADKQVLTYDESEGTWKNINCSELINVFVGSTSSSNGVSGLVPAPSSDERNGFLSGDGSWVKTNESIFEYVEDNGSKTFSIQGFIDAENGSQLIKNSDGQLQWIKPSTETVDGIQTNLADLRSSVQNLKDNTYTKGETDEKIGQAVANASHLKRKIFDSKNEAEQFVNDNDNSVEYIIMIKTGLELEADKYHEYLVISEELENGESVRKLEPIGTWEVNLDQYVTITLMNSALSAKVDKEAGSRLIKEAEINKLDNLLNIESVNGTLEFTNGTLGVKTISTNNISDLNTWANNNASSVKGLSENNFSNDLLTKLTSIEIGAQVNNIKQVDQELDLTNGTLSIKNIASSKIVGLNELLATKADINAVTSIENEINAIKDCLIWQSLDNDTN